MLDGSRVFVNRFPVVVQFDCHPEQALFCAVEDLGEPREASQPALRERKRSKGSLRRNGRAFGSLPYQTAPLPVFHIVSAQDLKSSASHRLAPFGSYFNIGQTTPIKEKA